MLGVASLGIDATPMEGIDVKALDEEFRLREKGMPHMRGGGYGDLYVQVNTEVPVTLNSQQKELLEKFREIENEKSNPSIKKFFQKAKSFWKN